MKICIIIRGPIRPNKEAVLNNIKLITDNFNDYNYDLLFATWNENTNAISNIIDFIKPKYSLILNYPIINYNFKSCNFNTKNCFNQFYIANKAIDFAITADKYDFFVLMRSDLKMTVDLNIWIKKNTYITMHSKKCGQRFTNDQFGIAPPDIMKAVWKYDSELSLCNLINNVDYPEQIIDINIDNQNLPVLQERPILWEIVR